jgi:hypothetical protein
MQTCSISCAFSSVLLHHALSHPRFLSHNTTPGGHFEGKDLRYTELEAYPMLYERGAMLTNEDTTMAVLAGTLRHDSETVVAS